MASALAGLMVDVPLGIVLASSGFSGQAFALVAAVPVGAAALFQILASRFPTKPGSDASYVMASFVVCVLGMAVLAAGCLGRLGAGTIDESCLPWILGGLTLYHTGNLLAQTPWLTWVRANLARRSEGNRSEGPFHARRTAYVCGVSLVGVLASSVFLSRNALGVPLLAGSLAAATLLKTLALAPFLRRDALRAPDAPGADGATDACVASVASGADGTEAERGANSGCDAYRTHGTGSLASAFPSEPCILSICACLFILRVGVGAGGTFFNPYAREALGAGSGALAFLAAIPLFSRMLLVNNWGRLIEGKKLYEALLCSMAGVCVLPLLWASTTHVQALYCVEIFSGAIWSGFDLVGSLFIARHFSGAVASKQALFLAANAAGGVAGSLLAGAVRDGGAAYETIFFLSFIIRTAGAVGFVAHLRRSERFRFRELELRSGMGTLLLFPLMRARGAGADVLRTGAARSPDVDAA